MHNPSITIMKKTTDNMALWQMLNTEDTSRISPIWLLYMIRS